MENRLAIIINGVSVSWFALFVTAGCLAGLLTACLLRRSQRRPMSDVFVCTTIGIPVGILLARWVYFLFSASDFSDMSQVIDLTNGGYGLYGAILGVFMGSVMAGGFCGIEDFEGLADCLAIGGVLAVAAGRFATYFTGSELGYEVNFSFMTVYDAEHDLHTFAVYVLDGLIELVILAVCLWFFRFGQKKGREEVVGGKTALVALALHGANAVLCESMRADALKLGANEFIKISQIIGIVTCVGVLVYFIAQTVREYRFRFGTFLSVLLMLECIAFGVLAEYRVGKGNYIRKHLMMLGAMLVLCVMVVHYAKIVVAGKKPGRKAGQ